MAPGKEQDKDFLKWVSKCEFKCRKCGNVFGKRARLENHIKLEHSMKVQQYISKHGPLITKKKLHKCRMCSCQHLWTEDSLYKHFRYRHGMTHVEYFEKYFKNNPEALKDEGQDWTPDFSSWISKCEFKCKECGNTATIKANLVKHIRNSHFISKEQYIRQHGPFTTKKKLHKCRMCSLVFTWTQQSLQRHFKQQHKISVHDYYREYIEDYPEALNDEGIEPKRIDDRLKDEAVSKWAAKCEFQCKICNKAFTNDDAMRNHIKKEHSLTTQLYMKDHGPLMTKRKLHQCRLCSAKLTWTYKSLENHLRKTHAVLLCDYYKEYFKNNAKELTDKGLDPVKENKYQYRKWHSKCRYACQICNDFLTNRCTAMMNHVKRVHKIPYKEYLKDFGPPIVKKVVHKCKFCLKTFIQDFLRLHGHFMREHQMPLQQYYDNYIKDTADEKVENEVDLPNAKELAQYRKWHSKCTFKCKKCNDFSTNNAYAFMMHLKNEHRITTSEHMREYGQLMDKVLWHQCKICSDKVQWNRSSLYHHMKVQHKTRVRKYYDKYIKPHKQTSWAHGCTYSCQACGKFTTKDRSEFYLHLNAVENLELSKYIKKYGISRINTKQFRCVLCSAKVIHCYQEIKNHLESYHKIEMTDFYSYFIGNQDDATLNPQ